MLTKEIKAQIQEAQGIPSRINRAHIYGCAYTHNTHPTYIIFKLLETKNTEIILMAVDRGRAQRLNKLLVKNYAKQKTMQ